MATTTDVSKLFIALFNRGIDAQTLSQYSSQPYGTGLIGKIIDTDPAIRGMSNKDFVELFYKNALGKDVATDATGINYWTNAIASNNWTKEQFLDAILKNVNAYATNQIQSVTPVDTAGLTVFNAKIQIAEQAATTIGKAVDSYYLTFGAGLDTVTAQNASTAIANALNTLKGIAARNPVPTSGGTSATLSAENPNFTPETSGGATKADDTINAKVTQDAAGATLTSTTQIDGGAGFDVLNVDMKGSFTGFIGASGSITNVEQINLTNSIVTVSGSTSGTPLTFNAAGIENVYTYTINGAYGVKLENIAYNDYLEVALNGVKTDSGTDISFNTTPTGGKLNLSLTNVGYDSVDNRITNHDISVGQGIGRMQIHLVGENYADIKDLGVNRITVGGSGSLDTNLSSGVTYFNGSNATGNLTVRVADAYNTQNTSGSTTDVQNGSNIFTYFATGSGQDKVDMNVSRLSQNAFVDTGRGDDTLTLTGSVRSNAEKQFYNLNTVENLVVKTDAQTTLLLDLGTTLPSNLANSGDETSGSAVPSADRSANLKTITFEDAASAQLSSLGAKDLKVTYNGTKADQKILADHTGTTDLTLQGTGNIQGAGVVNLSNTKTINLDLTGQGFSGMLSAGKAETLNITNFTGDKTLTLLNNTANEKNDLSSVKTISINTEAQDTNGTSINLQAADLASLSNVTLKGTGGTQFGELSNSGGITINGADYSGRLTTKNIFAGNSTLSITTKGAITTGNLTGGNITIDLSKNITTTEGEFNNNIGTIFIGNGTGTGGSGAATTNTGTLNYTTGISGTKGTYKDANGKIITKEGQDIIVNAQSATLNINGQGGVDKFNIQASAFTKNLVIKGDLGTVPDTEVAKDNYDQAIIDLSKTSGVKLDTSSFIVNNPNDGNNKGLAIIASKGQDTITLAKDANFDVITLNAGGTPKAKEEVTTIDFSSIGNTLQAGQSISFNGVTLLLNQEITTNAASALAKAVASILETGKLPSSGASAFTLTGILTDFDSKAWTPSVSGGVVTLTSTNKLDIRPNLNFTFEGNQVGSGTIGTISGSGVAGEDARPSATGGTTAKEFATASAAAATASASTNSAFTQIAATATAATTYTFSIDSETYTLSIKPTSTSTAVTASNVAKIIAAVLEGKDHGITAADVKFGKGSSAPTTAYNKDTYGDLTGGWTVADDTGNAGKLTLSASTSTPITSNLSLNIKEGNTDKFVASATAPVTKPESYTVTIDGTEHKITFNIVGTNTANTSFTKADAAKTIAAILEGSAIPTSAAGKITDVKLGNNDYPKDGKGATDLTGTNWSVSAEATSGGTPTGKLKLDPTTNDVTTSTDIKIQGGAFTGSGETIKGTPKTDATQGTFSVDFKELKAGQTYELDGKIIVASKDLSAEQVAQAFTLKKGDTTIDGATIISDFSASADHLGATTGDVKFTFSYEGSKFIATTVGTGATAGAVDKDKIGGVSGSNLTAINTGGITITTVDGNDGTTVFADSYILIQGSVTTNQISNFTLNTTKMDTIENFEVSTDRLSLGKFNPELGVNGKFTGLDVVTQTEHLFATGTTTNAAQQKGITLSIDANGTITTNITVGTDSTTNNTTTLTGTLSNGIINFTTQGATLAQKLAALQGIAKDKIVALAHEGDIYVVAGGADTTLASDDTVVKLTGIANDLSNISGLLG